MKLKERVSTWEWTKWENRFHRYALIGLTLTCLVLAFAIFRVERVVVLVPPYLEGQVSIAREHASKEVKETWALYVAELLGNVSPGTADELKKVLEPMLAPSIRRDVLAVLDAQIDEIQRENVSMRFTPRGFAYNEARNLVYVTGQHTTMGPAAKPVTRERTFEVGVAFQNYRPEYTHIVAYEGQPRTEQASSAGHEQAEARP